MALILDGTNGETLPSWTTATRPASPAVGQMGYNTTTGNFDVYTSAGWSSMLSSTTSQSPSGFAGNGPAFSAWSSGTQSITNGVSTKITFNTEFFDTNSNFNNTGSAVGSTPAYAFLPTVAGYYQVSMVITLAGASGIIAPLLYKNGNQLLSTQVALNSGGVSLPLSILVYLNGSTDYIESYVYQTAGSTLTTLTNRPDCYQFSAGLVRAA
jgi:hypothetical protein